MVHPIGLFVYSVPYHKEMSSRVTVKPRTYFLKRQTVQKTNQGGGTVFSANRTSVKESIELKDYAEKMIREQRLSSQKLNQLVWLRSVFDL